MRHVAEIMQLCPVIPVLVIDEVDHAVPLAEALVAGDLRVLEVTLRTPVALEAIRAMKQVSGAVVGAGTVLDPEQLDHALAAGSEFIVSPGLTGPLGRAAVASGVPFLPGVATSGEIMRGLDLGLTHFKFVPAMAAGGIPALQAIGGPFAEVRFCPTGGITEATAPDWLALDQVLCVGGSWIAPRGPVDRDAVEAAATRAAALR